MSRILVTGSGGFLGRRLVPALVEAGHDVTAVFRAPPATLVRNAKVIVADLTDAQACATWPADIETVIHAAAARATPEGGWSEVARAIQVNVLGTLNVLRYADANHIAKVLYCSTLAVYTLPQPLPIREDGLTYPVGGADAPYAMSKLGGELVCAQARAQGRLECLCLRLGRIYGPGERSAHSVLNLWVRQARSGEELLVYGGGERSFDFIYVDDAVRAIRLCLEGGWTAGTFNLSTGVETTWRTLAQMVAEIFSPSDRSAPVRYVPEGNRTRCVLNTSLAKRALGFTPRFSLREGLLAWKAALDQEESAPRRPRDS